MDKVLLVSVIALAVALLSMLVNLALVWKISDLKHQIEWLERGPIDDLKYHLTKNMDKITKLENDTKDAFEIVTNNLKLHGTLLDEMSTKFALLDGRVSEHHKQLEDLGNFAGITTGELRVLEQKIYNSCKPKELPEPEPIAKQFEDASLRSNITTNNIEINSLGNRVSILENRRHDFTTRIGNVEGRVSKLEDKVSEMYETINKVKLDMVYHTLALNSKIVQVVGGKDVAPKEVKPDRRRKDNYYRKPNKSNVIIDEFASDIIE